jgi:16S rRNA (cytosine1402-N4)-methyltransferase
MGDTPETPPHKRRVRYKGTHPRTFKEKYKELNPEKYAEDVAHVISRGDTPAGTHRSICLNEVLAILDPKPGEVAVDATLGYGGHTRAILAKLQPGGKLFGFDVDPTEMAKTEMRIRNEGYGSESFVAVNANFASLARVLASEGQPSVDMVLADLGVSSMQIDNPERGFTFKREGPLDMRMNQEKGETAAQFLNRLSEDKLASLLEDNSDEPDAKEIAHIVHLAREGMTTTGALSDLIRRTLSEMGRTEADVAKAERRVFQAIRIGVNRELQSLETLLEDLPSCLAPGGRAVILTFHSGEDNRVVQSFNDGLRLGLYSSIFDTEIRESREERFSNPRSRSVRLRWAIRA